MTHPLGARLFSAADCRDRTTYCSTGLVWRSSLGPDTSERKIDGTLLVKRPAKAAATGCGAADVGPLSPNCADEGDVGSSSSYRRCFPSTLAAFAGIPGADDCR